MFVIGLSLGLAILKKVLKQNIVSVKSEIITDIYIIPQYFEKCYRKSTKKPFNGEGKMLSVKQTSRSLHSAL